MTLIQNMLSLLWVFRQKKYQLIHMDIFVR